MIVMKYLYGLVVVSVVFSVMILGVVSVPYQGVIVLMLVSFICCIFMVMLGRTFAALVMYIVYLGGLIVVFGYCVSVEKGGGAQFLIGYIPRVAVFLVVIFLWWFEGSISELLIYIGLENLVCLEVNGGGVFYFDGGAGLLVCSWGLLVVLFSVLIILGWSRLGGLRPF